MRGRVDRLAPFKLALALALAGHLTLASAQSIAYTVQVVALSDQEAALGIQTDLLREGFPAYVVRSTSDQGDVFRVRVGAFADRASTLLYASGMPGSVEGSRSRPWQRASRLASPRSRPLSSCRDRYPGTPPSTRGRGAWSCEYRQTGALRST